VGVRFDVPLVFLVVLLPIVLIALMPVILVQRYRVGTARRLARPLVARLTLGAMLFSAVFFVSSAAVTAIWVPRAFTFSVAGLVAGLTLGVVGLWLTRWEATPRSLYYTPNRWLVLFITLLVSARIAYGLWRSWRMARAGIGGALLIEAFGVAESMAAAATVIGYYLAFSAGLQARVRRWQRRPLRPL
jgi:hypothetical protein